MIMRLQTLADRFAIGAGIYFAAHMASALLEAATR